MLFFLIHLHISMHCALWKMAMTGMWNLSASDVKTLPASCLIDGRLFDIDIVFAFIKLYEFKESRILQLE